jgi:hypothetical protein
MSLATAAERLKAEAEHVLAEIAHGADLIEKTPLVQIAEKITLPPNVEQALADFLAVIDAELNPVDPASLPAAHFFGGPAAEPASQPEPVTVADQKAAGVAPEDTVTVADQRAGVPVTEAAGGTVSEEPGTTALP